MHSDDPLNNALGLWNRGPGLLCALVLAFLMGFLVLPSGFITGTHPYWLAQNQDITQYQAGMVAFIQESWHIPLLRIESLNWPQGTLATFADIIPLYALLLKALAPFLQLPPNPFGYWVGLCLGLQAFASWWVLRAARINDAIALIGLTLLLLYFPAWLARMGHISLLSQWLIVLAIGLAINEKRTDQAQPIVWWLLIMTSLFINIYLCAMVIVIAIAQAMVWPRRLGWLTSLAWIGLGGLSGGCILWLLLWPFPPSTGAPDGGYGLYSANLLALFSGTSENLLYFGFASPEQAFEGFNYLGLGGLMLCLILLLVVLWEGLSTKLGKQIGSSALSNSKISTSQISTSERSAFPISLGLAIALAFMAAYSLSNQVYIGPKLLLSWNNLTFLDSITGQFRASGRFLWPLGYGALICSVIVVYRSFPRALARSLIILGIFFQGLDLWPQLQTLHSPRVDAHSQIIEFAQWQMMLPKATEHLYFFPKMRCAQHSDLYQTLLPTMRFATQANLTINTAYLARYQPICHQEQSEIASSDPSKSVYIFTLQEYNMTKIEKLFPVDWRVFCQAQDFANVCTATKSSNHS